MRSSDRYRWFVIAVFFVFMLLHQTDRLMIGSMQVPIMDEFSIRDSQWGLINSGALVVATLLYPVWGYLYDRYARAKLLALASFIWGATTWLSAIAPTYPAFLATRASTGVDDSSYPGLYSLVADYFPPGLRGRVYGLLQVAQPLGFLVGVDRDGRRSPHQRQADCGEGESVEQTDGLPRGRLARRGSLRVSGLEAPHGQGSSSAF